MFHSQGSGFQAGKAITIARVSTDEQEEYSPAAQNSRMQDYCKRHNLDVLSSHEITESSTRGERKGFIRIIDQASKTAKKLREPVAIITDKVDRLQRGFKQQPLLEKFREEGLLEYHFSSDNCVIHQHSPAKDLFMWNIAVSLAQNYTDSLRDNVNRAKEQKLARGEWIGQAPIGYLNVRDERYKRHGRGKAEIHLDPVRAPLIRQLFEKYATGCYSIAQIVKWTKDIGLTNSKGHQGALSRSHVHKILQNPFYYGVMRLKSTGEEFPHIYEPIISKALFDQCRDVRTGRNKSHARYGRKPFLLRGLVTCANTGKHCTAQQHNKTYKNGTKASFTYLVSYAKDDPKKIHYVREDNVMAEIEAALSTLTIGDTGELKDVLSYINKAYQLKRSEAQSSVATLRKEYAGLEHRLARLTDLRLDGELSSGEFIAQKKRIKDRLNDTRALIKAHETTDDQFTDKLNHLIELAADARNTFTRSGFDQKRELLSLVFQNLHLDGKKLTFSMNKPFDAIALSNKTGGWCQLVDVTRTCEDTRKAILTTSVPDSLLRKAA